MSKILTLKINEASGISRDPSRPGSRNPAQIPEASFFFEAPS